MRIRFSFVALALFAPAALAQSPFSIDQVKSYPFPNELTAAPTGNRIAWAFNEQGKRNIWVAEGPSFAARQLTQYGIDDGQELSSVQISRDGKWVVYLRGGDHGSNFDDALPVNVLNRPTPPKVQIFAVAFDGGEPKALGEGEEPTVSPLGDKVAFTRDRAIWIAPIDGSSTARKAISVKGDDGSPVWSPDGARLAFVSFRGDHSFIGIYANDTTPMQWISPTTSRDAEPRWAPDGSRIVFVRRPGTGGAPDSILAQRHQPWALWMADAKTGEAHQLWKSPTTLRGSVPSTEGGYNLHWAANGRIVFLSYMDGWPHLYSIAEQGGPPMLLTPGNYMAEYISLSPDGKYLAFAGNAGGDADDIDRRHVVRVPVDRAAPELLTPGSGLEWTPVFLGDGSGIAYLGATSQRPPLPAVMNADKRVTWIGSDRIPSAFPTAQLVTPKRVVFSAPDGMQIHAQLFDNGAAVSRRPAVVYVHGGPPRQMLLGWHYSDYYANAYAMNQYLAGQGFMVLSVNYRLGIGYGREFHHPRRGGAQGASEYQDVKAAAEWLRKQSNVDPKRIGIYGGSYGGFLTAMALARNSDLFAAGVDIHGVHDWSGERARPLLNRERYETAPDVTRALDIAWQSSPISSVATWRSPVLLIHADDDRNVRFSQTVDLIQRLAKKGVDYEEIVIPDDTHHFMKFSNQVRVDAATAAYLARKLMPIHAANANGGTR